jgi:hypothetical protein
MSDHQNLFPHVDTSYPLYDVDNHGPSDHFSLRNTTGHNTPARDIGPSPIDANWHPNPVLFDGSWTPSQSSAEHFWSNSLGHGHHTMEAQQGQMILAGPDLDIPQAMNDIIAADPPLPRKLL